MLTQLVVRDLAIVDNLAVDLGAGMTVLTGETGAGKSLIVDALELAVGERASADLVRTGASAAEVTAVFDPDEPVRDWLREHALDDDDDACVLRRLVGADGRSRAFINGRPVPVSQLRSLGERLVDVHGQHAHQALLKTPAQRELLDTFVSRDEQSPRQVVAALHRELDELDREIAGLGGDDDPAARLDFLRFQIDELEAAPIALDRLAALSAEHRRQANAVEILRTVAQVRADLDDGERSAASAAGAALRALESAARLDSGLGGSLELLRESLSLIGETGASLRRYADGLEADDALLAELERQLVVVHDLARKHRCSEAELHQRLADLEAERERIKTSAARLHTARERRRSLVKRYAEAASKLSEERCAAARRVEAAANEVLASLGMDGAALSFAVRHEASAPPTSHGLDQVSLEARTNPGQPSMPLARVASGGELSRIALAIHAVAVDRSGAGTVVFDEVDAGVGGAVAEIVGRRMRELGAHRQVLTVTHLPQVAALAHGHVAVRKAQDGRASRSEIRTLGPPEREQEVARMLGGLDVTRRTLEHAREMLSAAAPASRRGGKKPRPAA